MTTATAITKGDAAIEYVEKWRFSVFPVGPDKRPLMKWEQFQRETPTPDMVRLLWSRWPDANIGIVTGEVSGLVVIDVDVPEGLVSLKQLHLQEQPTRVVKTPRGGFHLYYFYTPLLHTGAGFLPGIDVRAEGGYVVAPPSEVNGKAYAVVRDLPIAELDPVPPQLIARSRPQAEAKREANEREQWVAETLSAGKREGERNQNATRLVGYFHHKGIPTDIIKALMVPFCERCEPPMDELELQGVIDSVRRYQGASCSLQDAFQPEEHLWNV